MLLRPLERYIPPATMCDHSILDVGCATGKFLDGLRRRGFHDLHGIEMSPEAVANKVHPSLDIRCASLEQYAADRTFDLVTLHHVFEHFEDPNASLAKLHSLLSDDGTLVMAFPNARSVARGVFGRFWPGWDAPRHYFTFSPKNLDILAQNHDMRITRTRYISRPSQFTGSMQYIQNELCGGGRLEGFWRKSKLLDLSLFPATYALNAVRVGDMIEVHMKKK
jgi:SAM-dependent methyltransferase